MIGKFKLFASLKRFIKSGTGSLKKSVQMILKLIFVAVVVLLIIKDYLKKLRVNRIFAAKGIQGPRPTLPLIGDAISIMGLNVKNTLRFVDNLTLKYGKVFRLWCFNKCLLVIQDAKYLEAVLSSPRLIKKAFFYNQIALWLGDGLVMSSGFKWQQRRKIFTPAFHMKILEQFVEIFNQQALIMVEKVSRQADGLTAIDISPVTCETTLDILLETAMGVKINANSSEGVAYGEALISLSRIAAERFVNPLKHNDWMYKLMFNKTYRAFKKNTEILHNFTEKVIAKRREELKKKSTQAEQIKEELSGFKNRQRITFLDILLLSTAGEKPLTDAEIREEVDTFTFGGHDTVTLALSYVLYLISRHPQVQQKLFKEILNTIGPNKTEPIKMRQLHELRYLECVIKETMRLYPPGPIIGRQTNEDYTFGDQVIPAGTNMILLIYAIARDADYFSRPNEFIPERFCLHNNEDINPYASVPFSAGPRNCIGQKYAILEIKTIVCFMMRNFELLPAGPDVNRIITLVLRSTTGIHLGLRPRLY